MANNPNDASSSNENLIIGNRAVIIPSMPLPEFDTPGGRAFGAHYKGAEGTADLIAILCDKGVVARHETLPSIRNIDIPGLLRLVDSGTVVWPDDNRRYFTLAYQRPATTRMKQSVDEPHPSMSEDFLNNYFIMPMINVMIELQRAGVVHNAIRPSNIFWRIGNTTVPQLGECLSMPAGYGQPALFEPIERALCHPMGRGVGHHADDCYALGVIIALLVIGTNPFQGMDDAAIIRTKLERGTFGAFVGNRRISSSHIEILRGLLADDIGQRWTGVELEQWIGGRRSTPKNSDAGKRAARAFEFQGNDYWQARPLAAAMALHVPEAALIIENGSLDKWLRRAVNDDTRATNLAAAHTSLKQTGKMSHFEDQLVARACIALDPDGPIRYRGVAVMPAGIGAMLIDALMNGQSTQILSEIISSQLVSLWVEMQREVTGDLVPLGQLLERMKGLIEKSSYGNGVERVVYELNTSLPCLSTIVRSHYVTNGKTLLTALERVAGSGERPQEPMDRHIAAFLIVRERRSELQFDAMSAAPGSFRRGMGMLTLYTDLQEKYGPESLPNLAQWLMPALEASLQRYLGKTIKERVREQVKDAVKKGNLALLMRFIDDPKRVERDKQEFMAARMLYLNIMKEIAFLENRLANREIIVRESGKPLAATISTLIAIFLMFAAILRAVWQMMFGA